MAEYEGNIGAGGAIAPGNGFPEVTFGGFLNKNIGASFEQTQQKFVSPDALSYTVGRLFKDLQGMAQAMSISSVFAGAQFSPGTMFSLGSSNKIPSVFSAGK